MTKPENKRKYFFVWKRIFDLISTLICLIFALPIMIIFSILILLDSKGSPIYRQKRLGKNGEEFYIYKLRSMYENSEINGPKWTDKNDDRITKVGRFMRRYRIDELPQFFNILIGDMSFIGPRPERKLFHNRFKNQIPNFDKRLSIRPGLTGLAQVNGGYEISIKEKLDLDIYYIDNINFILDLKIIIKTVKVLLSGKGAR